MGILDLGMSGMGGIRCKEELQLLDPDVRGIIASGYLPDVVERDSLAPGAGDFVEKPSEMDCLPGTVRRVLGR